MDGYIKKYLIAFVLLLVQPQFVMAESIWSDLTAEDKNNTNFSVVADQSKGSNPHINSRRVSVNFNQLKSVLFAASSKSEDKEKKQPQFKDSIAAQIELPMPDGGSQSFYVSESSIMELGLANKYPQIKTYKVVSVSDVNITGRIDIGPKGFHAYLRTPEGLVYVDPIPAMGLSKYYSYYKHDYVSTSVRDFSCGVKSTSETGSPVAAFKTLARTSGNLITYRVAISTTGEYSQSVANGNLTDTLAEIVTLINRINEIYERDLAIRLELIANNSQIIYTNAFTDPFTNPYDDSLLLTENQETLDYVIGSSAYDLGHVLNTTGGGLAALGAVCDDAFKAQGESGSSLPTGDPFYIDLVAHEMGHQLGAEHSFNGTTDSCAGNRNAATAFEPGSGTTIMSYAGICGAENAAVFSDATFHAGSIAQIIDYTRNGSGNHCATTIAGQQAPTANAGSDYTIPGGTAFTLHGSATDPESNNMTYQWDQMDAGASTTASTYGTDNGSNTLFRSFEPTITATRTLPQLSTILNNEQDKAETLPTENRALNFRLTARDGNGGVNEDDMQIEVDGNSGPFEIVPINSKIFIDSSQLQAVQWNAACTEMPPVNCANVDILLSTDDGQSFNSLVNGSTANDGVELVSFANINTSTARIKISCTSNIFFDITNERLKLSSTMGVDLPTSILGGSYDCGTAATTVASGDDLEPNNYSGQAQDLVFPSTLNATINDIQDPDDFFVFVASTEGYTFTLGNYGNHDLDLYLLDETGFYIIDESTTASNPTEVINTNLVIGKTYYLVVNGWDTLGQDVTYTLNAQGEAAATDSNSGGGVMAYHWLFVLLMTPLFRCWRRL